MFGMFKGTIIGPNPYPWPRKPMDTKDVIIIALLYLMFLILTKGVATATAFSLVSQKYGIAESVLRKVAKEKKWL